MHPGVVPTDVWLQQLSKALLYHLSFAAVPLLCLCQVRWCVGRTLLAGSTIYPMLLLSYGLQHMFIYELRSFWMVVLVFAGVIARWVDGESRTSRRIPEGAAR